jgi:hypothetical protein
MTTTTTEEKRRTTIFIKPSIVKHARAQAVVDDTTLSCIVERALLKYLPKVTVIEKFED